MKSYTEVHEFLVSVLGSVPYGVIAIDMRGYIMMANEQSLQSLDIALPITEVLETNIIDYVSDIYELKETLEQCFHKGRQFFELSELYSNEKYLNIHGKPVMNGMVLSFSDITENKKAQNAATLALLEGQETERQRLAKEIHDGIGPLMSTIRMNLDAVKGKLIDVSDKTKRQVETMDELITNVAVDIRSISHALMPSALIDFGLNEALANMCKKVNHSELVKVNFYKAGMKERLEGNLELNLFRIAQELLNNALKYSQAKEINIQLINRENKIVLTVEDDGVGFDPKEKENTLSNGIGMRNIMTRISTMEGEFSIDTQPGKGVHAMIEVTL